MENNACGSFDLVLIQSDDGIMLLSSKGRHVWIFLVLHLHGSNCKFNTNWRKHHLLQIEMKC